ncbi:MAG: hypothetical protein WD467_01830 [Candidatus Saccharimonadales bacterium]
MAANPNYVAPISSKEAGLRPKLVEVSQAQSWLLRALSSSIAIRNRRDIPNIPERVPLEMDYLLGFIENEPFEVMQAEVARFIRKEAMRYGFGKIAIGSDEPDFTASMFPTPGLAQNVVAAHTVSAFGVDRFGSVYSAHLYNLPEVDLSAGMPKEKCQQDRAVLLAMASAICDVDQGVTLVESTGAQALGFKLTPVDWSYS